MSNRTSSFKLVLPSKIDKIEEAAYFAEKIARKMHFSKNMIDDIAIATTEVVSNAIIHGNKSNVEKKVTVDIVAKSDQIVITVTDEGAGFKLKEVKNPLLPENLLKENGRGIYILMSLMDEIDYHITETGTMVTLIKYKDSHRKQ